MEGARIRVLWGFLKMIWKKNVNRFSNQSTNSLTQVQRANTSQTTHWLLFGGFRNAREWLSLLSDPSACP